MKMIYAKLPDFNNYELMLAALEEACEKYKISVDISFKVTENLNCRNRKWKIRTMGKLFTSKEGTLIEAAKEAMIFVMKAHGEPLPF